MDMFTLHLEHAVLLGLFTVLTLINCRVHDGAKGVYWFPAYTLCAFVGAMFVVLRGHGVPETVSILFGVTFFHLAYLFLHRGLDKFFVSGRTWRWPMLAQFAAVAVAVAGLVQFAVIHPNTQHRLVFYSAVFAFQTALIGGMVLRNARGHLATPGMLMGGLLGLLTASNVIRALTTLREGAPANYLQSGLPQQLSLLEITVLQGGITVAFVWMSAAVLHDRLDRLASTDSLTGLLNRRALEAAAEREIALSRKNNSPLSAILIDLDRFKRINDTFGHAFGDRTLQAVGRCLQEHMRRYDLVARVGGDEFAVMLHDTGREEAMEVAERLRASLEELVVVHEGNETRVFASFGAAQVDSSIHNWNQLIVQCDKAVYEGKEVGGNLAVAH